MVSKTEQIDKAIAQLDDGPPYAHTVSGYQADHVLNELVFRLSSSLKSDDGSVQLELRALVRRVAKVHYELDVAEARTAVADAERSYKNAQDHLRAAKARLEELVQ